MEQLGGAEGTVASDPLSSGGLGQRHMLGDSEEAVQREGQAEIGQGDGLSLQMSVQPARGGGERKACGWGLM